MVGRKKGGKQALNAKKANANAQAPPLPKVFTKTKFDLSIDKKHADGPSESRKVFEAKQKADL